MTKHIVSYKNHDDQCFQIDSIFFSLKYKLHFVVNNLKLRSFSKNFSINNFFFIYYIDSEKINFNLKNSISHNLIINFEVLHFFIHISIKITAKN